jgi:bacterioferritin-associated ferredoxin
VDNVIARRLGLALTGILIALFAFAAPAAVVAAPPTASAAQEDDFSFDEDELTEEEEEFFADEEEDLEEETGPDEQVVALERATGELGRAKRAAAAKVARLSSATALAPCMRGGPGWKRIRGIKHASQRSFYTAAARRLLADMKLLLDRQQPQIAAYESAFERFVGQLRAAPVTDSTLREAVAAQARRLAAYRDVRGLKADCATFNKLTKRVREFPTRTAAQIVRADYRSAPIARKIERHISDQLRKIDRRHGIAHRDAQTLAAAAERMVELGGEPGYATGFQYALSLR